MASTLRMPTTISPGQWQPWAAVSPLWGLTSMTAVGSETLYCPGEFKPAILAYMAGIWSEMEGNFFFFPQYPHPFMHLPSKLHSMEANPGSEIRNPGLWSPEYSLRIPLRIKIQNPSSSYGDWNPVPGILKSVMEWNRESQIVMDSRDIALQVLSSRSLQLGADCWCSSVWLRISLNHFLRSHRYAMCLVISLQIKPSPLARDVSLQRNVPSGEERARQSFITQLKYSSLLRR